MHEEYNKLNRPAPWGLAFSFIFMMVFIISTCTSGHVAFVKIVSDETGHKLRVDDTDFFVNGMNWDYYPVGTKYNYNLWDQPEDFIIKALENEMTALQEIGVNAIRQYVGVPPRWVKYIYENYGIFTILNYPFGRYGMEIEGQWIENVDYGDPATRDEILTEVVSMVESFRYVPGVLMWLLGNENNYGIIWESTQTMDMPEAQAKDHQKARDLYSLYNEAIRIIHIRDNRRPVAIANGDVQFIDLIAQEIEKLDIFGTNSYRGSSFGDLFQVVHDKLGIPVLFTEFGADAYHAVERREDQHSQARYLLENWKEIYENSRGLGRSGNAIGGCTFQFSDGWWKSGPDDNLDIHDNHASWANGGYLEDFVPGRNNMNEEWFGICAKENSETEGLYRLLPRKAYYLLKEVHQLNPLSPGTTPESLQLHFERIRESLLDTLSADTEPASEMQSP
jgi:hypothetical protein